MVLGNSQHQIHTQQRKAAYLKVAGELSSTVVATIVLVLENVDKSILIPNHGFPVTGEFDR